ncbi:MAG: GDSL-like lipase/acylhydrolase family protein [Bacteroidota bacterium]|nr:GDSL-like lipase/acylhydrolase family protein [Bacteroidota bacterium]
MNYKSVLQKAVLVLASILLSVLLAEILLRLMYPVQTHYFVWQPNLKHTFTPDSSVLSGLQSPSSFTINSYGIRTDEEQLRLETLLYDKPSARDKAGGTKYFLCLGGSTTECLYLNDDKTWPMQIRRYAWDRNLPWFVGNIGKSGCTTRENYIQLKYCVPQYKKFGGVILMVGLNDLVKRLSQYTLYDDDFRFNPAMEDSFVNNIFLKQGRGIGTSWLRRTALFYAAQKSSHNRQSVKWEMQDDHGAIYKTWRQNRRTADIVDTLPDLNSAFSEFERNLNLIIDEAQKQKLQVIFVNQSALWRDSMPENETGVLWMGGIGNFQQEPGHTYYSARALRKGLDLYNQKLAEVCTKRKVLLVDIDKKLPHDLSVFYDDCHFNINGAKKAGQIVFDAIKQVAD